MAVHDEQGGPVLQKRQGIEDHGRLAKAQKARHIGKRERPLRFGGLDQVQIGQAQHHHRGARHAPHDTHIDARHPMDLPQAVLLLHASGELPLQFGRLARRDVPAMVEARGQHGDAS